MSRVRIPLSLLKIKARPNGLAFIFIQLDVDSTQSNRGAPAMSRGERGPVDHNSGKCLNIAYGSNQTNANVEQYKDCGSNYELWWIDIAN